MLDDFNILDDEHLKNKSMKELREMFPDVEYCDDKNCDFSDFDHGIYMQYEQHDIDMIKKGMIKILWRITDPLNGDFIHEKTFHWFNGKKWVEL